MSAQIVVFPRGQLNERDREMLRDAGVVAIEADDPAAVVTVLPLVASGGHVSHDAMTMALLWGVEQGGWKSSEPFVKELRRRLVEAETTHRPTTAGQAEGV